jgi:hypothetical protein
LLSGPRWQPRPRASDLLDTWEGLAALVVESLLKILESHIYQVLVDPQQPGETGLPCKCIDAAPGLYHPFFGLVGELRCHSQEALFKAITRANASDRFVSGSVDPKTKTLTLLRGDNTAAVAPFCDLAEVKGWDGT